MDKPRRVLKTLTCLVGAMTCTATLLGWMDPSPPLAADPVNVDELQSAVDRVVYDNVSLAPDSWNAVQVVTDLDGPVAAGMLAGRPDEPTWHFYIDHQGRPSRTQHWYRQVSLAPTPGHVRIAVAGSGPGEPMSDAQGRCLQVLIGALGHAFSQGGDDGLPIQVDENWGAAYGVVPNVPLHGSPRADSAE